MEKQHPSSMFVFGSFPDFLHFKIVPRKDLETANKIETRLKLDPLEISIGCDRDASF